MALNLVHESNEELRFDSGWGPARLFYIPFVAIGGIVLLVQDDSNERLAGVVLTLLSAVVIGRQLVKREGLILDLRSRTFVFREGMWPAGRRTKGAFTEFTGLELATIWMDTDEETPDHREWHVNLLIPGADAYPVLSVSTTYDGGVVELQRYAKLLNLPATDWGVPAHPDPKPRKKEPPDIYIDLD